MCCEVNWMAEMDFSSLSLGNPSMVVFHIIESRKDGLSSMVVAPTPVVVAFKLMYGRKKHRPRHGKIFGRIGNR
jgi:hypothetical protein